MPKNHISNPYIGIIEMFESENRKLSNQNRKIEIGKIEAEIRIEATQLTKRIMTALLGGQNLSWGRETFTLLTTRIYLILSSIASITQFLYRMKKGWWEGF